MKGVRWLIAKVKKPSGACLIFFIPEGQDFVKLNLLLMTSFTP